MSLHSAEKSHFTFFDKPIHVEYSDDPLTSDAGLLPIRQFDELIGYFSLFQGVVFHFGFPKLGGLGIPQHEYLRTPARTR